MIVSELIIALQKLPQDATVFLSGSDYPEEVRGASKLTKKDFDGYYYSKFGTNEKLVIKLW